jgi:hypothetical protein
MQTPRRRTRRTVALVVGLTTGVVAASATALYAAGLQPDGVHLRTTWTNGGEAWLELEDRNVEPLICFIWDNDAPQDGDSIASRILTRTGSVVLDLGTADQWIHGAGEGCEIPTNPDYRDVFANPSNYVVEFKVVEDQGTLQTSPVRSRPLQRASD